MISSSFSFQLGFQFQSHLLGGNCLDVGVCVCLCIWFTNIHTSPTFKKISLLMNIYCCRRQNFRRHLFGCWCVCAFLYLKDTNTHTSSTSKKLSVWLQIWGCRRQILEANFWMLMCLCLCVSQRHKDTNIINFETLGILGKI